MAELQGEALLRELIIHLEKITAKHENTIDILAKGYSDHENRIRIIERGVVVITTTLFILTKIGVI